MKMDQDAATVMNSKLIKIGHACYRRLDFEPDGLIQDFTQKLGGYPNQPYIDNTGNKNNLLQQKHYRIDEIEDDSFSNGKSNYAFPSVDENDTEQIFLNEEEELQVDNRGNCELKIHVSNVFFGFLIGKRGQTKSSLESETKTTIKVPQKRDNRNSEGNFIHIYGRDRRAVCLAKKKIDELVESARKKQDLTHFVSIPLGLDSSVRLRFEQFKKSILSDIKCSTAKGIDEKVFQHSTRLHLTLRALYLGDLYERKRASALLQSLKNNVLSNKQSIELKIKGLDIMNDDPSETNVLYAKVEEVSSSGLFKQIVNQVYDCFSPLAKDSRAFEKCSDGWKVKIHATLMNVRWLSEQNEQHAVSTTTRDSHFAARYKMDVRNILEKYENYDFGTVIFDQLHICTHRAFDENNDFYYLTLAKISL